MNGRLFFAADDGMAGLELWTSDGTAAGTRLVKDIDPGIAGSAPEFLTNVNGTLFFRVEGPAGRFDLWKSDGTAGGTVPVKLQVGGLDAVDLVNVNGTLFFDGNDGVAGMELWKSDGTAAGTMLVADLDPSGDGFPFELTNANGTLFFRAQDPALGEQLWTSDGTSAGTVRLTDINPPRGARARFLTNDERDPLLPGGRPADGPGALEERRDPGWDRACEGRQSRDRRFAAPTTGCFQEQAVVRCQ